MKVGTFLTFTNYSMYSNAARRRMSLLLFDGSNTIHKQSQLLYKETNVQPTMLFIPTWHHWIKKIYNSSQYQHKIITNWSLTGFATYTYTARCGVWSTVQCSLVLCAKLETAINNQHQLPFTCTELPTVWFYGVRERTVDSYFASRASRSQSLCTTKDHFYTMY